MTPLIHVGGRLGDTNFKLDLVFWMEGMESFFFFL